MQRLLFIRYPGHHLPASPTNRVMSTRNGTLAIRYLGIIAPLFISPPEDTIILFCLGLLSCEANVNVSALNRSLAEQSLLVLSDAVPSPKAFLHRYAPHNCFTINPTSTIKTSTTSKLYSPNRSRQNSRSCPRPSAAGSAGSVARVQRGRRQGEGPPIVGQHQTSILSLVLCHCKNHSCVPDGKTRSWHCP